MADVADTEYSYSIVQQKSEYTEDLDKLHEIKMEITKDRTRRNEDAKRGLLAKLPEQGRLMLELASEKGASSWLTALPIKEFGYLCSISVITTHAHIIRYCVLTAIQRY